MDLFEEFNHGYARDIETDIQLGPP